MTVTSDNKTERYEGNGVTDTFAFSGRVFTTSDFTVTILDRATDVEMETLLASDFTVTIINDESASITVDAGKIPASDEDILISRTLDRNQDLRLPTGTAFPAKAVEDALDKVTVLVQDVADGSDRSLKYGENVSGITDATMPAPVDDYLLAFDGTTGAIKSKALDSLEALGLDVVYTGLAADDFLAYNGTSWVNKTAAQVRTILGLGALALKNTIDSATLVTDGVLTYAKLAATSIADSAAIAAGTASKIVDAATLRSYLDASLVTPWTAYTPTFAAMGTVTNIDFAYRRVGKNMEIMGRFTTGTVTGSTASFTLPTSRTVDNTAILTTQMVGSVVNGNNVIATAAATSLNFSTTSAGAGLTAAVGTSVFSNTTTYGLICTVPIEEWS